MASWWCVRKRAARAVPGRQGALGLGTKQLGSVWLYPNHALPGGNWGTRTCRSGTTRARPRVVQRRRRAIVSFSPPAGRSLYIPPGLCCCVLTRALPVAFHAACLQRLAEPLRRFPDRDIAVDLFGTASSSAMASIPAELRRSTQRRDSSSSTSSNARRPRLLRASATEPSIATSNACRGVLASPQSSRRATDLLSQVAYVCGSPPESLLRGSSPPSTQSPVYARTQREERGDSISSSTTTQSDSLDEIRPYQCWCSLLRVRSRPSSNTWTRFGAVL